MGSWAVFRVIFQSALLFQAVSSVSVTATLTETHAADTHRYMRVDEPKAAVVEVSARGAQRDVSHQPGAGQPSFAMQPAMQSALDAAKREGTIDLASVSDTMDVDVTASRTKEEWEKFKAPEYPCNWNVQVSRADKGAAEVWRTFMVNGSTEDRFHFHGCTTIGEEAFVCQHDDGAQAGVRLMRNSKDEVIGFGSCCKTNMVNAIIATNMGQCVEKASTNSTWGLPTLFTGSDANSTAWSNALNSTAWGNATFPQSLFSQSGSLVLRLILFFGVCLFIGISSAMYCRFKK